jgi:hypothetical protein
MKYLKNGGVSLTEEEARIVRAMCSKLSDCFYSGKKVDMCDELLFGMSAIYERLRYRSYCERHGVKYEDMDEQAFCDANEEEFYMYHSDSDFIPEY